MQPLQYTLVTFLMLESRWLCHLSRICLAVLNVGAQMSESVRGTDEKSKGQQAASYPAYAIHACQCVF